MFPLVFGIPGGWEPLILLVIALLIFGGTRLAGIGKGAGQAVREFKDEMRGSHAIQPPPADIEPDTVREPSTLDDPRQN